MKNIIIALICALSLPFAASAQGQGKKPDWADYGYHNKLGKTYLETVVETGSSYEQVRASAAEEIARRRIQAVGVSDAWIKAKPLSEYWEITNGTYTGYFLYQTPHNPSTQLGDVEAVSVTDRYPVSARVLIPGMAQLHKGSKGKGIAFIVGEVAAIGGIVACEGLRASYESKINSTHNATDRQKYIDNASTMQNIRNGCIAGAAAIYVWSMVDGIVAKGRPHVVVSDYAQVRFAPYVVPGSTGLMASLTF